MSGQLPTRSELQKLSYRGIVCYAVRCAMRVAHLTKSYSEKLYEESVACIQVATKFCLVPVDDIASIAKTANAAREAREAAYAYAAAINATSASTIIAASASAVNAVKAVNPAHAARIASRADFRQLLKLTGHQAGQLGDPIDPDETGPLGPLWPKQEQPLGDAEDKKRGVHSFVPGSSAGFFCFRSLPA